MKIAVLNNAVPYTRGGAEHLADALVENLNLRGHRAMLVRVPFSWNPPGKIVDQIIACRLFQLPNVDRAIGLKFPAYFVPHRDKVLWLLHQFRGAYDLYQTPLQGVPPSEEWERVRESIHRADNEFLPEVRAIHTISRVTGDRLRKFNGIESQVLPHPLASEEQFSCVDYGDFIFSPGRVTDVKRQTLLAQAMKHCATSVKLVIAGRPEQPSDRDAVQEIIRRDRVGDRVVFLDRFISEEEKADYFSRCLACAYVPFDEDSFGYVTMEACLSKKPTITCEDSGGTHDLVSNSETGFITPPEPRALAAAMDALFDDRAAARRMGEAAFERSRDFRIGWDRVVETLTS